MPDEPPIHGVDALEIFMNREGMALKKVLLEKGLPQLPKERK
jgi:hypothetical protein